MALTSQASTTTSITISVCIATHQRPLLLSGTLAALSRQTRLPDEIVISYFSEKDGTNIVVTDFKEAHPHLITKHAQSQNKSLPYQRWWAYSHSTGEVILFLDDDVLLAPTALQVLDAVYIELGSTNSDSPLSGIGFFMTFPNGTSKQRRPESFEERWLELNNLPSGKVNSGGLSAPLKGLWGTELHKVDRLSGGAMSFRRQVLSDIGLLAELVKLYDQGIGKGEDAVLSYYASQRGTLYLLPYPLAIHPSDDQALNTAYATSGWRKGLTETWGRAHTMRWMSSNEREYWRSWSRVTTLELLAAIWWGILRRPFSMASWARLAGCLYGCGLTLLKHNAIPPLAKSF
jgi:glycosyltransferase involved in cell wall biosynthesis